MTSDLYILGGPEGRTPEICDNLEIWGSFFQQTGLRIVKQTLLQHEKLGTLDVSIRYVRRNHVGLRVVAA